jgi:phosphoribosylaminoimidazolecarboxamide formyltransferase / IMP cyclohydrolase
VQSLHGAGYEIVSTGGSAKAIESAGVPVTAVDALTGFPEMLDGRVKTLHPAVHGGILACRDVPAHVDALAQHGISPIDVVVVNLYPFRATVTANPPPAFADGIENIDIGGPAMIRAAAKNHAHVTVVVDPGDYGALLEALKGGDGGETFRRRCAWKAFQVCLHARLLRPLLLRGQNHQLVHTQPAKDASKWHIMHLNACTTATCASASMRRTVLAQVRS